MTPVDFEIMPARKMESGNVECECLPVSGRAIADTKKCFGAGAISFNLDPQSTHEYAVQLLKKGFKVRFCK